MSILQDSPDDWHAETLYMSQTYRNALLNISADTGVDSRAGCFVKRDTLDITPLELGSTKLQKSWVFLPGGQLLHQWAWKTPPFTRAWIHRERQLARRVLHFTERELIWECCGRGGTSFASEMFPEGGSFETGLFQENNKYQVGRLQKGLEVGTEETYATWNDVCEQLAYRALTVASDRPIILSGLAKEFSSLLPGDEFVAGFWRSTLPHSLLWSGSIREPGLVEYIAPSWSWLSMLDHVNLANRGDLKWTTNVAKILDIHVPPKYTDDPYGPVESGTIEIEGILRRIRVTVDEENVRRFTVDLLQPHPHGGFATMSIGESWDEYLGTMCQMWLDTQMEDYVFECYCLFIAYYEWGPDRYDSIGKLNCLLLESIDDESSTFARIGRMMLEDLYALKMRYEVKEEGGEHLPIDVDDDDWKVLQQAVAMKRNPVLEKQAEERNKKREERRKKRKDSDSDGDEGASITERLNDVSIAENQPQGIDALYHCDEPLEKLTDWFRLEPEVVRII